MAYSTIVNRILSRVPPQRAAPQSADAPSFANSDMARMILHRAAGILRASSNAQKISRDAAHNLRQTRIARYHMST